jgi:signal transduction histidine kinase
MPSLKAALANYIKHHRTNCGAHRRTYVGFSPGSDAEQYFRARAMSKYPLPTWIGKLQPSHLALALHGWLLLAILLSFLSPIASVILLAMTVLASAGAFWGLQRWLAFLRVAMVDRHAEAASDLDRYSALGLPLADDSAKLAEILRKLAMQSEEEAVPQRSSDDNLPVLQALSCAKIYHDMIVPVNLIKAYMTAKEPQTDEDRAQRKRFMLDSVSYLEMLVAFFSDATRISGGNWLAKTETVPLQGCLERCRNIVLPFARLQKVALRMECPDAGAWQGHEASLQRIVINLMVNGIRACRENGEVVMTLRRVSLEGQDYFRLCVCDDGHGMTPEKAAQVLGGHVRGHHAETRADDRPHLGLLICVELCKQLNCTIRVAHTQVGHGTTMEVRLPAGPPVAARIPVAVVAEVIGPVCAGCP